MNQNAPILPENRETLRAHVRRQRIDFALSANQREEARQAIRILEGSGLSLLDAARIAATGRVAVEKISISEAVHKFLSTLGDLRETSREWYADKLGILADAGDTPVDALTRAEFRRLISSRGVSSATVASYARACRRLWRWMLDQEPPLAGTDPTEGVPVTARASQEISFFTPAQAREVVNGALSNHRAGLALMLFAGVRPEEVSGRGKPRMEWSAIDQVSRTVRVPEKCSKTHRARILEGLPDAFWRHVGSGSGVIANVAGHRITQAAKAIAGVRGHDILRHTFATYAVALTSDVARVSLWLGHEGSPAMLHRHYRALATKAQAEEFFSI